MDFTATTTTPGVDYESMSLSLATVAALTLEDLNVFRSTQKGKSKASDPPGDFELALRLQEEEARRLLDFAQNYSQIAQSSGGGSDGHAEWAPVIVEEKEKCRVGTGADECREAAVALAKSEPLPSRSSPSASPGTRSPATAVSTASRAAAEKS